MTDAEFDAPETPKPAPMRRPAAARPAARPTIEGTAKPAPKQEVAAIDPKAKEIADLIEHSPAKVLTDPEALEAVLTHMRSELAAFVPDLTTDKGRKAIASFAHKFSKSKTAIDDAGKELNSTLRAQIDKVDEVRRKIRGEFDELRDQARKPLDDWEAAQEAKADAIKAIEAAIVAGGKIGPLDTAADIDAMVKRLSEIEIDESVIGQEAAEQLGEKRLEVIGDMVITLERVRRAEEDAAELAKVRAENERLQEVARHNAAADLARQQEEADRVANEAAEAEKAATAQRIAIAQAEQQERDRSALALEQQRRESDQRIRAGEAKATIDTSRTVFGTLAGEALRKLRENVNGLDLSQQIIGPEYLSIGDLRVQLVQEIDRRMYELEEQAAASARQEHRKKINTAVRDAIWTAAGGEKFMSKERANAITLAIKEGKIPHTRIDYTEQSR